MTSPFTSQRFQKFASIGVFLFILLALPFTIFEVKQQQTVNQHAANNGTTQTRYCNGLRTLTITTTETPDCTPAGGAPFGVVNGLPNFQVKSTFSGGHQGDVLQWGWGTYFCATEDPHASCHNGSPHSGSMPFGGDGIAVAEAPQMSPTSGFSACGYYQFDLAFKVVDSSGNVVCSYGDLNQPDVSNTIYAWCHSGTTCQAVSTPTPTITPPTETPTATPTITPPTQTPTATPTITPPTSTPTITPPTSTPTVTNPPTGTPTTPPTVIVRIPSPTPKPTIPPTGPGNTLVGIGIIGAAIAVLGLALSIGL